MGLVFGAPGKPFYRVRIPGDGPLLRVLEVSSLAYSVNRYCFTSLDRILWTRIPGSGSFNQEPEGGASRKGG